MGTDTPEPSRPKLTAPLPAAASLELKASKENAHSRNINSVAYNHDGTRIVSACNGGTLKVWDAGASALTPSNPQPKTYRPVLAAASLELKAEKEDAHSDYVRSVAFSPDGKTIVSGSDDKTIKVWDAGTPACPIPHLAQT